MSFIIVICYIKCIEKIMKDKDENYLIDVDKYPILKSFLWFHNVKIKFTRKMALDLYERQHRYFFYDDLKGEEKEFFDSLVANEGKGLFLD